MLNDDTKLTTEQVVIEVMKTLQDRNEAMSASELYDALKLTKVTKGQILALQTRCLKGKEHRLIVVRDIRGKHYKLSVSRAVNVINSDIDEYFKLIKQNINLVSNKTYSDDKQLTDEDKQSILTNLKKNISAIEQLLI